MTLEVEYVLKPRTQRIHEELEWGGDGLWAVDELGFRQ